MRKCNKVESDLPISKKILGLNKIKNQQTCYKLGRTHTWYLDTSQ